MADDEGLSGDAGGAAGQPSLAARRMRAAGRRGGALLLRLLGRQPVEGCVDRAAGGDIRGWAFDPNRPGRRVHVVARCDGEVVAEALADQLRRDLMQDGRGDGRHGFVLRLPPALPEGSRLKVEAVTPLGRARLVGGEVTLAPAARPAALSAGDPAPLAGEAARGDDEPRAALVLYGRGGETQTMRSWEAQDWPHRARPLSSDTLADEAALRAALAAAHTVIFAPSGEILDPAAARQLVRGRPLHDVITWDGAGQHSRRPEARALGVLLGEGVGTLAVRGHVAAALPGQLGEALARFGTQRLALQLAAQPGVRWAHAPAPLSQGRAPVAAPMQAPLAAGLSGMAWRGAPGPGRIVPTAVPSRISLAVWPGDEGVAPGCLRALVAAGEGLEIELVLPDDAEAPDGVQARRVAAPAHGGAGAWMRALSEAAGGEVVAICRGDLTLEGPAGALAELAAWALHPLAGAVTIDIRQGEDRLAGLALERDRGAEGAHWAVASAFRQQREGGSRPVLAAPSAFLVVGRARLAALGGVDAERFPGDGADLDLGMRLRAAGASSVLLGHLGATARTAWRAPVAADLAPFDPAELAGAHRAYPKPRPSRDEATG